MIAWWPQVLIAVLLLLVGVPLLVGQSDARRSTPGSPAVATCAAEVGSIAETIAIAPRDGQHPAACDFVREGDVSAMAAEFEGDDDEHEPTDGEAVVGAHPRAPPCVSRADIWQRRGVHAGSRRLSSARAPPSRA